MAATGRAVESMTNKKLQQLLHGSTNYLSWEQLYIQRKFYPDPQHFDPKDEQNSFHLQKRFESFANKHNGDKPLLILDVDNTILHVRFFSEELQINDICTYFSSGLVQKNNSKVIKIRLTFSLIIQNNLIIDKIGTETIDYFHWISSKQQLDSYHKDDTFTCDFDGFHDINCRIQHIEASGCKILVNNDEIEIDFTQTNNDLNQFEPMLERKGMSSVDFIYEGFLVRVRPNLDEFMEYIVGDFDVVLYTAADKDVYSGLLNMLHTHLKQTLGRETDDKYTLWNDVLYRDDCRKYYDMKGKPHCYKDLTLFGCHLSRCLIIDNSKTVCLGLEPNFIFIKDFIGYNDGDDELMEVYQYLNVIACIKGDIRYFLCDLEYDDDNYLDLSSANKCLNVTKKLMHKIKETYGKSLQQQNNLAVVKKRKLSQTCEHKHKMKPLYATTALLAMKRKKSRKKRRKSAHVMQLQKRETKHKRRHNSVIYDGDIANRMRRKFTAEYERLSINDRLISIDGNLFYNLSMKNNIVSSNQFCSA